MPLLAAGGAILLWSTLAALGLSLAHLPPFLLTGCALVIGALPGAWHWRAWRVPLRTLAARRRRAVRLPFPAVSRAAPGAAGRSQSRQLSVAAAHRRADAGAAARLAPDPAPCDRRARGSCWRGALRSASRRRRSRRVRRSALRSRRDRRRCGRATRCSCGACRHSRRGRSAASRSRPVSSRSPATRLFEPPASLAAARRRQARGAGTRPDGRGVLSVGRRDEARRPARRSACSRMRRRCCRPRFCWW